MFSWLFGKTMIELPTMEPMLWTYAQIEAVHPRKKRKPAKKEKNTKARKEKKKQPKKGK